MSVARATCISGYGRSRRLRSCAALPASKLAEVEKPINVLARQQALPNEALLDILSCVDRRTLDNLCLIRRLSPLPFYCDQLRVVCEVHLGYSSSTYLYSVRFTARVKKIQRGLKVNECTTCNSKKCIANAVSIDATSLEEKATDVFVNALRHSRVVGAMHFENVELSRYFVDQLNSISNRYALNENSPMFASVSLSLNASLADFIGSFSSVNSLSPSVTRWLNAIGLDDILLDRLASNGVLNFAAGASSWNCRKLSDDALISFAFGDSYANDRLRSIRGFECQLSKTFIVKLVQARRKSVGNNQLFLDLTLDKKPVAAGAQLSIEGLRQHGLYDNGKGVWRFTFEDLPDFRIDYEDRNQHVYCYSNVSEDSFY